MPPIDAGLAHCQLVGRFGVPAPTNSHWTDHHTCGQEGQNPQSLIINTDPLSWIVGGEVHSLEGYGAPYDESLRVNCLSYLRWFLFLQAMRSLGHRRMTKFMMASHRKLPTIIFFCYNVLM